MSAPIASDPDLGRVLEAKRQQLAQLQEEVATLERAYAILSQSGKPSRSPAKPPRAKPTQKPRRQGPTIGAVVLEALKKSKNPLSLSDMYQVCERRGLNVSRAGVKDWILKAHRRGIIHRVQPGRYALAPGGSHPATAPSAPAKPAPSSPANPAPRPSPMTRPASRRAPKARPPAKKEP